MQSSSTQEPKTVEQIMRIIYDLSDLVELD